MQDINDIPDWFIFGKEPNAARQKLAKLMEDGPPPWRDFVNQGRRTYYEHQLTIDEMKIINAAIYLRRPLIVTGEAGTGKSSLAYSVQKQLGLDKEVLVWPITSRTSLKDGLYSYDAIGRLQAANLASTKATNDKWSYSIEKFVTLGPVGTAFADSKSEPRILVIDEIDKSDIDLPNDLLHLFEEGMFEIPELAREAYISPLEQAGVEGNENAIVNPLQIRIFGDDHTVGVTRGRVMCQNFPIVFMTSNRERELPAPLLRRCLRLHISKPDSEKLRAIVQTHFQKQLVAGDLPEQVDRFIKHIIQQRSEGEYIATDQLMNAVHLLLLEGSTVDLETDQIGEDSVSLINAILESISKIRT